MTSVLVYLHNSVVRFNNHMISYIYEYSVMCSRGVNLDAEAPGLSEKSCKKILFLNHRNLSNPPGKIRVHQWFTHTIFKSNWNSMHNFANGHSQRFSMVNGQYKNLQVVIILQTSQISKKSVFFLQTLVFVSTHCSIMPRPTILPLLVTTIPWARKHPTYSMTALNSSPNYLPKKENSASLGPLSPSNKMMMENLSWLLQSLRWEKPKSVGDTARTWLPYLPELCQL